MHWYWIVLIVFGVLALVVIGVAFYMFLFAFGASRKAVEKMFADRQRDPSPLVRMRWDTKDYMDRLPYETLTMTSRDGLKLSARFFPNGGTKKVVVQMHGWHSRPYWDLGKAFDLVYDAGYAVLAVSQRAQGDSEGKYLTYGAKESDDLIDWIRLLLKRYGEELSIAITGVSMGAATVLCATGKNLPEQVKCAVSDCSFTSAREEFRSTMKGKLPIARAVGVPITRLFAGARYSDMSPITAVTRSVTPTLFVHGDKDDFVPYPMMQKLYDACAAQDKDLWTSPGAVHAEAAMTNPEAYAAHVLPWLHDHL
jgi:fermentation-respiration switch protein FrsA (DUF1100 family)